MRVINVSFRANARTFCFCLLLMTLAAACTTPDPVSGRKVYNLYSLDDDIQLGRSHLQSNNEEMRNADVPIDADRRRVAQLQEIVNRLSAVSDLPNLPYTVTLYHTNIVNAAAAPGGSMMVFEGLWDRKEGLVDPDDTDELAAVMAHEIAHVNCRHVTERLTKLYTAQAAVGVGSVILAANDQDDLATALEGAFVVGTVFWIPSYTRKDETEADRVGIFYMARAGYDPRAAPRIWKRAAEKEGAKDKASIFATHPADRARYEELDRLLPYAMEEYARVKGSYPSDYTPPDRAAGSAGSFNWRENPKWND